MCLCASVVCLWPVLLGAQPARQEVGVAIAPFRALRADATTLWIGEGIQQALVGDLSAAPGLKILSLTTDECEDARAIATAKQRGAQVVIYGTFQTSPDEVRATGRVMLVTGQPLGVVSSRASLREVFRLQDDLARQVRDLLVAPTPPPSAPPAEGAPPALPGEPAPADEPAIPVPFGGSALERALADEDAGRPPWDGTRSSATPPPAGVTENPGGWGTPGFSGSSWGYGVPGSGYWGYVPVYRPPQRTPGSGGGSSGAAPPPSTPPATTPQPAPSRPPLVYPGSGARPALPP